MTIPEGAKAEVASSTSFTREQLYRLVWSRPLSQVSRTLGMSDVGLTKLCARNDIPTPPRGYWAMKRRGKAVRQRPLPMLREGAPSAVVVSAPVQAAKEATSPGRAFDPDIADALARARQLGSILLPAQLDGSHALVRKTHRELTRRQRAPLGSGLSAEAMDPRMPPLEVDVSEHLRDRALRIFDALIRSMESLGFQWTTDTDGRRLTTSVAVLGERFTFRIRERIRVRPFDPRRDGPDRVFHPRTVTERRGLLVIQRTCAEDPGTYETKEDAAGDLDTRLLRVLTGTIKRVQDVRDRRKARRLWLEERRLAEEARQREAERRRLEEARIAALLAAAARLDQAQQVRGFITACRSRMTGDTHLPEIAEWLAWAEDVAARLDPLTKGVAGAHDAAWNIPANIPRM